MISHGVWLVQLQKPFFFQNLEKSYSKRNFEFFFSIWLHKLNKTEKMIDKNKKLIEKLKTNLNLKLNRSRRRKRKLKYNDENVQPACRKKPKLNSKNE